VSLADWLDAGEHMLLSGSEDIILIEVVSRITHSESKEELDAGFEELKRLFEVRERQFRKAADKARREADVPRRAGEGELELAAAEWGMEMPTAKPKPPQDDE
jgi:hypothetical protein